MSRPVRDVEAQAARLATQLCDGRATVVAAVEARLLADPVLARAVLEQLVLHAALAADGVDLPGRLASELQAVNGEGRVQRITALVRGSPMARHRRRQSVFRRMGLAAALLLSVLGGLVWFRSPPVAEAGPLLRVLAGSVQVQATSRDRSRAVADELHLQPGAMVATGPGGSCIVQLDDGSRLELGPDSRLHWPMGPTDPPRVERGRVVCRIAPQGLGRFRLQVGALTVEVLGTVFTAIGRPAHDRVLVAEGRVVVYAEGRRLAVLAAEEGLRRNRDGRCLTWRQPEHPDAPVVADGPWLDADGGLLWGVDIPLGVRTDTGAAERIAQWAQAADCRLVRLLVDLDAPPEDLQGLDAVIGVFRNAGIRVLLRPWARQYLPDDAHWPEAGAEMAHPGLRHHQALIAFWRAWNGRRSDDPGVWFQLGSHVEGTGPWEQATQRVADLVDLVRSTAPDTPLVGLEAREKGFTAPIAVHRRLQERWPDLSLGVRLGHVGRLQELRERTAGCRVLLTSVPQNEDLLLDLLRQGESHILFSHGAGRSTGAAYWQRVQALRRELARALETVAGQAQEGGPP